MKLVIITNNFEWSAHTIAQLYKRRWDIEIKCTEVADLLSFDLLPFPGTQAEKHLQSPTCLQQFYRKGSALHLFLSQPGLCYVCNTICQGAKAVNRIRKLTFFSKNQGAYFENQYHRALFCFILEMFGWLCYEGISEYIAIPINFAD